MRNGIKIIANGKDISSTYVVGTLKKTEKLNNNRSTCSFSTVSEDVQQNTNVEIYDTFFLLEEVNIGSNTLVSSDLHTLEQKRSVGDEVYVGLSEFAKIQSISGNIVTLDRNLKNKYGVKTYVGKYFFHGIVDLPSVADIGKHCQNGETINQIKMVDIAKGMDKKVVIETFINQFFREILGLIVYEFVAVDNTERLLNFEDSLTGSGVCITTIDNSDRIFGNHSQRGRTNGAGTGQRTTTISSLDISNMEHLRFWYKSASGSGALLTSLKVRIGADSSNYYERDLENIGAEYEDCWNYEAVILNRYNTQVGTPSLSDIQRVQFEVETSAAMQYMFFDDMHATSGGYTLQNARRGIRKYEDVRFKGDKVTLVIEELAKLFDHYRYVDATKDIHYYYQDGEVASSFVCGEDTQNYSMRTIDVDATNLVNRQLVEGSEAPSQSLYTQIRKADGVQTSFQIDYKPVGQRTVNGTTLQGLKVFVNDVERTVGPEGLVDPSTVDFVFNFSEKVVFNASHATLTDTDELKMTYYPYKTVSVRYADQDNIAMMQSLTGGDGIYDGQIIIDRKIESATEARQRAQVEVDTRKNPIVTVNFRTDVNGLGLGQMIKVIDIRKNIDEYFQIQEIKTSSVIGNLFTYSVTATSLMLGYVEFFQLLLKKSSNLLIDQNADVIIPLNADETITIEDNYTTTTTTNYNAGTLYKKTWFFGEPYLAGQATQKGNVGSIGNQMTYITLGDYNDDYNSDYSLGSGNTPTDIAEFVKMGDTYRGGQFKLVNGTQSQREGRIFITPLANGTYTVTIWAKTNTDATIAIYEYSSVGSLVIGTHTIAITANETYTRHETTITTNASIAYYNIGIINTSGTTEIGEIKIEQQGTETVSDPARANFSIAL